MSRRVKAWERSRGRSRLYRKSVNREVKPRILIVCEGKETEPNYFKGFKVRTMNIVIEPAGAVHASVVDRALVLMEEDGDYEEIWCVFEGIRIEQILMMLFYSTLQLKKPKPTECRLRILMTHLNFGICYILITVTLKWCALITLLS